MNQKPLVFSCCLLLATAVAASQALAQTATTPQRYAELIPRNLLRLLHAPEVHQELELTGQQVADLEQLFSQIDSRWFASRILPADQQEKIVSELEKTAWDWFRSNTRPGQQRRLRQLESYAQAGRMLLRSDVAQAIGLDDDQVEQLAALARTTYDAEQTLRKTKHGDPKLKALQADFQAAVKAERAGLTQHVRPTQRQKLSELLGDAFDTTNLKRIYPMAPEFVDVDHWINSSPLKMSELRGKVVLVHFYAFQCHNCHANFEIYRRWHDQLSDKGVVVVGIQSPETSREHDPAAVISAAEKRQLEFPIMIDLEMDNWKAWGNTMWPTVYVVDKDGYIRHWWQGELNWKGATSDKVIEDIVDELLAEN